MAKIPTEMPKVKAPGSMDTGAPKLPGVPALPKQASEVARSAVPPAAPVRNTAPAAPTGMVRKDPATFAPVAPKKAVTENRNATKAANVGRSVDGARASGAIAPFAPSPLVQRDAAMREPTSFFPMMKTDLL